MLEVRFPPKSAEQKAKEEEMARKADRFVNSAIVTGLMIAAAIVVLVAFIIGWRPHL
jgi:formate/nitrite transporter FocA (FNT family)